MASILAARRPGEGGKGWGRERETQESGPSRVQGGVSQIHWAEE